MVGDQGTGEDRTLGSTVVDRDLVPSYTSRTEGTHPDNYLKFLQFPISGTLKYILNQDIKYTRFL